MKILHVATFVFPDAFGGAERYIYGLARAQAAAGHEVTVLTGNVNEAPSEEVLEGIRLVRYPLGAGRGIRFFLDVRREVTAALRRMTSERFDILHAHQIASAIPALSGSFPARRVLGFHASHQLEFEAERLDGAPSDDGRALRPADRLKSMGIAMLDRQVLRRAERIVVLTEFVRGQIEHLLPSSRSRVRVIPPGVDFTRFSPGDPSVARARLAIPDGVPLVVTVRRLVRRMGLDLLLEASAMLAAREVPGIVAIGGGGAERQALEELRSRLGLEEKVHFLGRVPDDQLPELLRAADLVVVPSRSMEGFGIFTMEALACGAAVVATDGGGSPEILAPIDPSLLVPAESGAIAAKMEELLLDPARRRAIAERCLESARARFSWPAVVARIDEVYRELVGSPAHA